MKDYLKEGIPETIEKTYVHRGFFDLRIDTIKSGNTPENYTVLLTKARAAAVLSQDICGRFLIIKEYRYPIGKWMFSIPGGRVEGKEPSLHAAKRELLEETGYEAKHLTPLCIHNPMPSVTDQAIDVFYSRECEKIQEPSISPSEVIQVMLLKEKELIALLKEKSSHVDSLLSSALFYLLVSKSSC